MDAPPVVRIRSLSKSYAGSPVLDQVDLDVARGSIVALLGRSGSGKTTLLQLIAGLQDPDSGSIAIDGADMTGVAAFERPVNMMFQSYALFPHMSVTDNIAYGLKARGTPRAERERLVHWALDLVRLADLKQRRPDQLSGGQRQRVALARCLVMKPTVLLLDEPMAALDKGLRQDVQRELIGIQRKVGTTFIMVTHDQEEAMTMADCIAVMEQGRIVQFGAPREVYEHPRSRFVASFLGTINLFEGRLGRADAAHKQLTTDDGLAIRVRGDCAVEAGAHCGVGVRPEKIAISRYRTDLPNDFEGKIEQTSYRGNLSHATIRLHNGRLVEATVVNGDRTGEDLLERGKPVHVGFAPDAAIALDK
jgi:putrescine transport system ATP-binding protein